MKKVTNYVVVEGKIFGMGRRPLRIGDDGRISGQISVLTSGLDDEQNIVEVNFIPQSPTFKNGKKNNNYDVLKDIIENGQTVEAVGFSEADSVNITGNFDGNAYYTDDQTLVEFAQVRGGFINMRRGGSSRPHTGFRVDALIMSIDDKLNRAGEYICKELKCQVYDDYNKMFFPISFNVYDEDAVSYISSNYIPGETYTQLDGVIVNKTVENTESEASGFGVSTVSSTYTIRENVITGGGVGGELPMLPEAREEARQNRESYLAEQKAYAMSRGKGGKSKPGAEKKPTAVATASGSQYSF